jgi:hypothetical protein
MGIKMSQTRFHGLNLVDGEKSLADNLSLQISNFGKSKEASEAAIKELTPTFNLKATVLSNDGPQIYAILNNTGRSAYNDDTVDALETL